MPSPEKNKRYTYADYCTWDDDKRWELIDGVPYLMFGDESCVRSPAPAWGHQGISVALSAQLYNFLKGKQSKVFQSPFDVRLNADTGDDTVFQPDIVVICDPSILSGTGCSGVPDMVIEILSPSTAKYDRFVKFNRYLKAGVREYWIVDHESKTVDIHTLENGKYTTTVFSDEDIAPVHVLEGCEIVLADVFTL